VFFFFDDFIMLFREFLSLVYHISARHMKKRTNNPTISATLTTTEDAALAPHCTDAWPF